MFTRSSPKQSDMIKKAETPPSPRREQSGAPSIISSGVSITGNIESPGEVQLDGVIKGDVHCHALTLGESGSITGKITAESITIKGRVDGEIVGQTVRLEKTAELKGDVVHQTLSVEAGARIAGRIIHSSKPLEWRPDDPKIVANGDGNGNDAPGKKEKPEAKVSPTVLQ